LIAYFACFVLGECPMTYADTNCALISHSNLALKRILIGWCSSFCRVEHSRGWWTFIRIPHD